MNGKDFDIKNYFSRLITDVTPNEILPPITEKFSEKKSIETKKIITKTVKNEFNDVIKNAMKLDTFGQYEEALSWYDMALKINPKDVNTMFKKALLLSKTKKYEQAIFLFDQIIEIDPTLISALINRKIVLQKLGKHFGVVQLSDKQFS